MLFQLDHLSTRARRNAENLIILGGGQPGRRWRNPVGLTELTKPSFDLELKPGRQRLWDRYVRPIEWRAKRRYTGLW